jgi:hypothetical protein
MGIKGQSHAATAIESTFGPLVDELLANFSEELRVAESIDMFHLTPEDWNQTDLAVFTVLYVAFLYKHWIFAEAVEAIERAINVEAERALERLLRSRKKEANGSLSVISGVDQLSKEWRALREAGSADTPFSRSPEAILFVCRHLLKPESQAKAKNLALMPFLQIYIPERFSEIQRATKRFDAPAPNENRPLP